MKLLKDLPVGTAIKSPQMKYNDSIIRFLVGHQESDRTKLVTERLITLKAVDAKEPENEHGMRQASGNNRYSLSNIDQWLNSHASANQWYTPKHSADTPPTDAYLLEGSNAYHSEAGFLANFDPAARNAILESDVALRKAAYDGGDLETVRRKIYLLSFANTMYPENGEGEKWDLFATDLYCSAYPTPEAVAKSDIGLNPDEPQSWVLRTAMEYEYPHKMYGFNAYGECAATISAFDGHHGIRPALELSASTIVSDTPDTDGAYIIQWNRAPSDPLSITYGIPAFSQPLDVTIAAVSDPEGDTVTYIWESRTDDREYLEFAQTTAPNATVMVPATGTTFQIRVKAVDSHGSESGYCTGMAKTIIVNTPPAITGTDENLGAFEQPFTYSYSVSDAESGAQTLTVTEFADQTVIRTFTATAGQTITADIAAIWADLVPGTHVLTISVDDGIGKPVIRKVTFKRVLQQVSHFEGNEAVSRENFNKRINQINQGLSDVIAAADYSEKLAEIEDQLSEKVEKENGKGLSSNDFTDAYKTLVDTHPSAKTSSENGAHGLRYHEGKLQYASNQTEWSTVDAKAIGAPNAYITQGKISTSWQGTSPATNYVSWYTLTASDVPQIGPRYGSNHEENQKIRDAWNLISRAYSEAGRIVFECFDEIPEIAVPIIIQVVR